MNMHFSIGKRSRLQLFRALSAAWRIEILRSAAKSFDPVARDLNTLARAALEWPSLILCMGLDLYVNPGRPFPDPGIARQRIADNIVKLVETNGEACLSARAAVPPGKYGSDNSRVYTSPEGRYEPHRRGNRFSRRFQGGSKKVVFLRNQK